MEKYITIKEFAKTLSMADVTIKKWIAEGKIKSVKIGSARRIPESELHRLTKEK